METAEPVGSRAVVRKNSLSISAATARNEMADLEEMGFLEQPHTSAGRVPSEKGFRYYVDCMMERENPGEEEIELFKKVLSENFEEWNEVIQEIGGFISQITKYASFVIVPSVKFTQFQYLHLIPIQTGQALLLIVSDIGLILHRKIDIPHNIDNHDLQLISDDFNQIFRGKRVLDISRTDLQLMREDLKKRKNTIDNALEALEILIKDSSDEKLLLSGTLNIFREPEFKDIEKLKKILMILDEKDAVKAIIPDLDGDEIKVSIGRENKSEDIQEMSLVSAGYKIPGKLGKIGVIGPVRMEYWKAVGTIETVRSLLEEILKDKFY